MYLDTNWSTDTSLNEMTSFGRCLLGDICRSIWSYVVLVTTLVWIVWWVLAFHESQFCPKVETLVEIRNQIVQSVDISG